MAVCSNASVNEPAHLQPTGIDLRDSKMTLAVSWADGSESAIPYRKLRLACHCALCVDEMSGKGLLDPDTIKVGNQTSGKQHALG